MSTPSTSVVDMTDELGAKVEEPTPRETKIANLPGEAAPGGKAKDAEIERLTIGGWIVGGLLLLIVLALGFIAAYAFRTEPDVKETTSLIGTGTASLAELQEKRHAAWFSEIKDLLQILIVGLLVPLLATLIGYLFGRQQQAAEES
jgi:hypothetical protein